jgi:CBS domain-containing protein
MKVSDAMTSQVSVARPTDSIRQVAETMAKVDSGVVPVVEDGKVVGLVTDRDIVIRVVAEGGDLEGPVSAIMSDDVQTCSADDNLADAAAQMASHQIRRLVVTGEKGDLVGILSLGDIATDYGAKVVGKTLEEISAEPPSPVH